MSSFLEKECNLEYFHSNGYIRKQCPKCKDYYWTLNTTQTTCGDRPCVEFSFIANPQGNKPLTPSQVRTSFLEFFEQHNHHLLSYPETGSRCPVIARWRSDIYLTIASIADFQPHITSGTVPPPANPLVISQPCIRLNDLEEVGKTGRHLTMFEMMGHHAFNKNTNEIYWKEETVAFCDTYFTTKIGIPRESITYKEQLWDGGGNAGPCLEVLACGLEIATLVFMNMKQDPNGTTTIKGNTYTSNPLNIVDTGYGLERIAWITQGTPTVYETVFPTIVEWIKKHAQSQDMKSIYSLADHTRCLAFMLGDGIVPSNVKAGYLARLIIRRALRFIEKLNLNTPLYYLVNMHLELLKSDFPELQQQHKAIQEVLEIEIIRFRQTLLKGQGLITRTLNEQGTLSTNDLIMFYDTHGIPPETVQNIAKTKGTTITIPPDFYSMIAELHSHSHQQAFTEITQKEYATIPPTKQLYAQDHYCKEFDATILWTQQNKDETLVILDQTSFYPDGGGQPGDQGEFISNNEHLKVTQVTKHNETIIHHVQGTPKKGQKIHGIIDWDHRYQLMKHHTGTHVVNGALQQLFGSHIWQAGSQLGFNDARFDFAHYQPLTEKQKNQVEQRANELLKENIMVKKQVLDRNTAEKTYGFRLYQGGVPPGNMIKILFIPGVDVEACGGTHVNNIKEIEKIQIIKTERIQDGVNRIIFAAGKMADQHLKEEQKLYTEIITLLKGRYEIINQQTFSEQLTQTAAVFSVSPEYLKKTLQRFLKESPEPKKQQNMNTLIEAGHRLFSTWKDEQKKNKTTDDDQLNTLKSQAICIPGTSIKVITAVISTDATITGGAIIEEPGYVVHLFDGKKISSLASEDVDIDLRKIAPELGRILGGNGGGKPKMTQSGGPHQEKIQDALEKAKQLTIKYIKT